MTVLGAMCCLVKVSLVQRGYNKCGVSEWDREFLIMKGCGPVGAVGPWNEKSIYSVSCTGMQKVH
jgi:hypothetical protein